MNTLWQLVPETSAERYVIKARDRITLLGWLWFFVRSSSRVEWFGTASLLK